MQVMMGHEEGFLAGEVVLNLSLQRLDPAIHLFRKAFAKGMDTLGEPAYDELYRHSARLPLFFVLSKTLGYLLLPTNFLIAIGFVGAILMATRFASLGRKLVIAAVLLLVICGLSPLGKAVALSAGAALSAMGRRARRA